MFAFIDVASKGFGDFYEVQSHGYLQEVVSAVSETSQFRLFLEYN